MLNIEHYLCCPLASHYCERLLLREYHASSSAPSRTLIIHTLLFNNCVYVCTVRRWRVFMLSSAFSWNEFERWRHSGSVPRDSQLTNSADNVGFWDFCAWQSKSLMNCVANDPSLAYLLLFHSIFFRSFAFQASKIYLYFNLRNRVRLFLILIGFDFDPASRCDGMERTTCTRRITTTTNYIV